MPVKSAKQFRFMQAAAHGNLDQQGKKINPAIAKEFLKKTSHKKKSMFAKSAK